MRRGVRAGVALIALALVAGGALVRAQDRRTIVRDTNPSTAPADGRKLALVIGNDTYTTLTPLKNARNDAASMAAALQDLGFQVTRATDVRRESFGSTLAAFADSVNANDVVLFFFAGHGVQVEGENYLLPVDVDPASVTAIRLNAVGASQIVSAFQKARVSVLVLDACRTVATAGGRDSGRGLAQMEARGSLIAFAAGVNQTASDNIAGSNGLFTGELIRTLKEPGLSLREVFFRVRQRVYERSAGAQFPAVYDGLLGDLHLRPAVAAAAPAAAAPVLSAAATTPIAQRFAYAVLTRLISESRDGKAAAAQLAVSSAGKPQAEIDALRLAAEEQFQKRLEPLLAQYSGAQQVGLLFNGPDAGLVWADPRLDVTADLVRRLDGVPGNPVTLPGSSVAYLVLQRLANESAIGKKLTAQVQAVQQRKSGEHIELQKTLSAGELQKWVDLTQSELQALQKSLQDQFQKLIEPVMQRYASARQLGMIFNGPDAGLVWADSRFDVTSDLIASMDQGSTVSTGTLPSARAAYVLLQRIANETRLGRASTAQIQNLQAGGATAEQVKLRQDQLQAEFQAALTPVLDGVARRLGLAFVFNGPNAGLMYAGTVLDISADVIQAMDAQQ